MELTEYQSIRDQIIKLEEQVKALKDIIANEDQKIQKDIESEISKNPIYNIDGIRNHLNPGDIIFGILYNPSTGEIDKRYPFRIMEIGKKIYLLGLKNKGNFDYETAYKCIWEAYFYKKSDNKFIRCFSKIPSKSIISYYIQQQNLKDALSCNITATGFSYWTSTSDDIPIRFRYVWSDGSIDFSNTSLEQGVIPYVVLNY